MRSRVEKVAGALLITVGLVVVLTNYAEEIIDRHLLPGGHSPLYLLLGVLLAAYGTWSTGVLDRKGM
jgi:hypothetical protein